MVDKLLQNLISLEHDDHFVVDLVLKESELERTEQGFFVDADGSKSGPYVRKTFQAKTGIGAAWQRIMDAQKQGKNFKHLPHVIDYYEAGEDCVVVMEYIVGETFEALVEKRGAGLATAKDLFPAACDAASELHNMFTPALIHRDIKPSNLMLSNNTVMLIDFGIARSFDNNAKTDTVYFGTRGFAPPEQFGFGQTDQRSDVYALGMVLFYLLTGQISDPSCTRKVMGENNLSQRVQDVVLKASAFDPAARYATAAELKEAFEEAVYKHDAEISLDAKDAQDAKKKGKFATLGVAWDVILAAWGIFLLCYAISTSIVPRENMAYMPFIPRLIENIVIYIFIYLPSIVLCDPRPLRRFLPRFANCGFTKRLLLMIVVGVVLFFTIGIINTAFQV